MEPEPDQEGDGSPAAAGPFHGLHERPEEAAAANRSRRQAAFAQQRDGGGEEYVWEYGRPSAGGWIRIGDDATQRQLEQAHAAGQLSCEYEWRGGVTMAPGRYSLDLGSMTQTWESTESSRKVRRRPLTQTSLAEQFDRCVGDHVVIPLDAFRGYGRIPRSSDALTVKRNSQRKLVFVSHRWLRPWMSQEECEAQGAAWAGTPHPDDERNSKHALIAEGLSQLAAREGWQEDQVDLWVDFACVEQDDLEQKRKGIESLLAFVTRADAVLIPSMHGAPEFNGRLQLDIDCVDEYGQRAWCMLECFAFWCVSMVRRVAVPRLYCAWRDPAGSMGLDKVRYDLLSMPSSGRLTNELDRAFIENHETGVRDQYGEAAIVARCVEGAETIDLGHQLLDARHVPVLLHHLDRCTAAAEAHSVAVDLSHNELGDGIASGIASLLAKGGLSPLRSLKLTGNGITDKGTLELASVLQQTQFAPRLKYLKIDPGNQASPELVDALRKVWQARDSASMTLHIQGLSAQSAISAGATLGTFEPGRDRLTFA